MQYIESLLKILLYVFAFIAFVCIFFFWDSDRAVIQCLGVFLVTLILYIIVKRINNNGKLL